MSHDAHDERAVIENLFTDQQWRDFRREDLNAGAAVVILMVSIFSIGVVLYSIVALTL